MSVAIFMTMLTLLVQAPRPEASNLRRYALLVGSNQGSAGEPVLRYADRDAQQLAQVLTELGGFATNDVTVLHNPDSAAVNAAFASVAQQIQETARAGTRTLLVVYFSGHADAVALHLGGTLVSWNEVLGLTNKSRATTRVLLVDACRSGEATMEKGTSVDAPFALPRNNAETPTGLAVLTSASANEAAQESGTLHGSFFTYHLISALHGAGDVNGDGKVTLTEAFQYSSEQTAASTAATLAGVQHAAYRYQLRGRADLVLTNLASQDKMLPVTLSESGEYIFHVDNAAGPLALEVHLMRGKQAVWLPAGHYYVQRRTPKRILVSDLDVVPNRSAILADADFMPVEYAEYASKGAPAAIHDDRPTSISLWGGTGSPVLAGFQMPIFAGLQVSQGFGRLFVDAQLGAWSDNAARSGTSQSLGALSLLAGVRYVFFKTELLSTSTGLRLGAIGARQTYSAAFASAPRFQFAPAAEAVARCELALPSSFFLALEGAVGANGLRTATEQWRLQPRGSLGIGVTW